ncbi:hypothetical protein [Lyngbya confervoides]|uniref:Uncharacterized protein n=1 Tax=Lyngbya confervoides BDU141951 TaxID=1574623 RepID=A0ABD4SYQ4_9CYAN|nr:hypothetical protein [Lyngbya confervoides]MCM1981483.1 hypothetical protein [Lyngbya confervoides BDU141951]
MEFQPAPPRLRRQIAERYLAQMPEDIRGSLTVAQLRAVRILLEKSISPPKPQPKIVDLRFQVDLFLARYYLVIMVGPERRRFQRPETGSPASRMGNVIAALMLLLGLNLMVSAGILLALYLLKSTLGLDFFPGHLGQQ